MRRLAATLVSAALLGPGLLPFQSLAESPCRGHVCQCARTFTPHTGQTRCHGQEPPRTGVRGSCSHDDELQAPVTLMPAVLVDPPQAGFVWAVGQVVGAPAAAPRSGFERGLSLPPRLL